MPRPQAAPVPAVVFACGFSGTKERVARQAVWFATNGLASLTFDYRSFGDSEGEPRQVVDLAAQQDDIRGAVAYLRDRPDVDPERIVLFGNSLGGAHVITVASGDPRIAAVIAQIPFNGFPSRVEGRSTWAALRLLAAMLWDAMRGKLGLRPAYIPVVAERGQVAVIATDDMGRHIRTLTDSAVGTGWRNEVAPRGLLQMLRYHPAEDAARLTAPLLVCIAVDDRASLEVNTSQLAERAPRGRLERYPGDHFDFYDNEETIYRALADQLVFIREHLSAQGSGA